MRKTIIIIVLIFSPFVSRAQDTIKAIGDNVLYGLVINGDTVLVSSIEEVYVRPMRKFRSNRELRKYRKLIRNVKKVYPYARIAKKKYDEVAINLESVETERDRKAYMKQVEAELKDEFEGDLKKLTISQGRILIKLIDREIGETSYELLQDLKGNFSAFFWQTLARLFGHNLKSKFDPEGEDRLLNEIVLLIENGQL